jgi:hypothetical protein
MSQQDQQRQPQQEKQRQREDSQQGAASQQRTADQTTTQVLDSAKQKKSDMKLEEAKVTEGKEGARNLRVQWVDVHLPNARSCRFAITTAAGNAVEAVMEQKSYRQSYQGTSSFQTGIVPVAPHGTRGKLTLRDLATGETLEQPWIWQSGAGGLLAALWGLVKRLFSPGS